MQIESGDTGSHIEARLPLHRNRLQCHGMVRAADQNVGADTGANRRLRARAAVVAGQCAEAAVGRRIDRPDHLTAGGRAEIEAEFGDRSGIDLTRSWL